MIHDADLNDTRIYYQRCVLYAEQFLMERYQINDALDVCLTCEVSFLIDMSLKTITILISLLKGQRC
jgi:hypothetical protein